MRFLGSEGLHKVRFIISIIKLLKCSNVILKCAMEYLLFTIYVYKVPNRSLPI